MVVSLEWSVAKRRLTEGAGTVAGNSDLERKAPIQGDPEKIEPVSNVLEQDPAHAIPSEQFSAS